MPKVTRCSILQGKFGAPSPKPTDLLFIGPTRPRASLRKCESPVCSKGVSIGLEGHGGAFQTAKLKEYPGDLCKALFNHPFGLDGRARPLNCRSTWRAIYSSIEPSCDFQATARRASYADGSGFQCRCKGNLSLLFAIRFCKLIVGYGEYPLDMPENQKIRNLVWLKRIEGSFLFEGNLWLIWRCSLSSDPLIEMPSGS